MFPNLNPWLALFSAFVVALVVCNRMTPPVKRFAERIGAMDIPKDDRRVHDHPIPRMGGLAIIVGFFLAVLLFVPVSEKVYGIVIGAFIIAGMGFVDDIVNLKPAVKLVLQLFAAFVCVRFGLVIDAVTWPVTQTYMELGWFGVPITMLWIVLCTNAFNLIDGLDGLAAGVTAICSFFLLAASILFFTAEPSAAIILTALIGACLGFIPFNFNPAKIFMGMWARSFWASSWPRCPSSACSSCRPWWPLPCRWRTRALRSSAASPTGRVPSRPTRVTSTTACWPSA